MNDGQYKMIFGYFTQVRYRSGFIDTIDCLQYGYETFDHSMSFKFRLGQLYCIDCVCCNLPLQSFFTAGDRVNELGLV